MSLFSGQYSRYVSTIKALKNFRKSYSIRAEEAIRQSELFTLEQNKQKHSLGRVEKIQVTCKDVSGSSTLVMNKNLSTPHDCARHLGEKQANDAALALINNDTLWHMHKQLPDSCNIEFLNYNIPQPSAVNKAFWRTCSFLLGAIANNSFKDDVNVQLHSFPIPNVRSGSFIYDVQLSLDNWTPTHNELQVLSVDMIKFCGNNYPIECLDVGVEFALLMFENNVHKTAQIPDIAANNGGKVTLFRAGNHIDISRGPMVANTNHLGRITIANVIKLDTEIPGGPVYRFQGVALPRSIRLNHFAYNILEERAKKLNSARLPGPHTINPEDVAFIKQEAV